MRLSELFPTHSTETELDSWVPNSIDREKLSCMFNSPANLTSQKQEIRRIERTKFYKLIGPRYGKFKFKFQSLSVPDDDGQTRDKIDGLANLRNGRTLPINFDEKLGIVEGNNGVAFRALHRNGRHIVIRGIMPHQACVLFG